MSALTIALMFGVCETRSLYPRKRSFCPTMGRRDQTEVGVDNTKRFYHQIIPMLDNYVHTILEILNNTLSNPQQFDTRSYKANIRICITEQSELVQQVGKQLDSFLTKIVIEHNQMKQFRSNLIFSSNNPLITHTYRLINGMCSAIHYAGVTSSFYVDSGQAIAIDEGAFYLKYLNIMLDLSDYIQFIARNIGIDI